jgi:hypothetical protein
VILATAVALALAAPPEGRADETGPTLDYTCEPPQPPAAESCAAWHRGPVTLRWIFDSSLEPVSGCESRVIDTDTNTDITCIVTAGDGRDLRKTATVRVDTTPPAVSGAAPDRPPDHDGWWNHPVAFTFRGSDATSGIAGCDTVVFSGPDTQDGVVTGGCRDVAGNVAATTAPVRYDATPPAVSPVQVDSGDGQVTITWRVSPDTLQSSVQRSPGRDGDPSSTVYSGQSQTFTDDRVAGGTTYTYTIVAVDAAANAASTVVIVTPGASRTTTTVGSAETNPFVVGSPAGVSLPAGTKALRRISLPRLQWRKVPGARYYNVQVYRGPRKILSAWPVGTDLKLRASWTFKGRHYRLTPGRYDWYAWPGFGSRSEHRYGRMITHKRFTIPKPA